VDAANDIELWLVDGFNVLHACVLAGRDRAQWWSSERQRQNVDWIAPFGTNHRVCVVFDAATETSTRCEPSAACVELAYAPSADDAIVERVRAHPMPPRRPRVEQPRPGDLRSLHDLSQAHQRFNRLYFEGRLQEVPFRLSGRMKTRLGEYSVNVRTGESVAITISRSHIRNEPWPEVEHTLLHEMVHQWQVESGLPLDHGPQFRKKAREIGIQPSARRHLTRKAS
jgi:hypothetical protein